jgi:hypothetical protein
MLPEALVTSSRTFPVRMRVDLQKALDEIFPSSRSTSFLGFNTRYPMPNFRFATLLDSSSTAPVIAPAQYSEVDVGEATPARCLENGLWLFTEDGIECALMVSTRFDYGGNTNVLLEMAVPPGEAGVAVVRRYFDLIESATLAGTTYRGKILSLEPDDDRGRQATGISVHTLPNVSLDDIILPAATLALIERNVLRFATQRARLADLGMSLKKGLLLYGPPGTGKTHTIKYLAHCLAGVTTLLITAEQMGLLAEYMALARLLQPSMVVIEDADLIARARESMGSPCEESLLNRLLNEMDGLHEDAEVLFVLTTNRPESLEAALTARPGRVDQAIEFPLPDDQGRARLVKLYATHVGCESEVLEHVVRRTKGTSAAFIKELVRRAAQCMIEDGRDRIVIDDVDRALEEMLFSGGKLNRALLGADGADVGAPAMTRSRAG